MHANRPHLRRHSMLRIKQLDMFLHLVESRSVSITAEKMCLTQSAVTKSLKELELYFDVPLFERTSRGLRITEFGKVVERYAEAVVSGFQSVETDLESCRQGRPRTERIGCTPGAGQHFIVQLIARLRADGVAQQVSLQVDSDAELLRGLRSDVLDYAVIHQTDGLDPGMFAHLPLGQEALTVVARPEHPLAAGRPSLERALASGWVMPSADGPACRSLQHALGMLDLAVPGEAIHASHNANIIDLALSMDLIALLPAQVAEPLVQRRLLQTLELPLQLQPIPFGFVYARRRVADDERHTHLRRMVRLVSNLREDHAGDAQTPAPRAPLRKTRKAAVERRA